MGTLTSGRSELGHGGEDFACGYLRQRGYRVIARNVLEKWGELDIVARARDKTVVFVEVKTMRAVPNGLQPEDQMTAAKLTKFRRTASLYAGAHPEFVDSRRGFRLDVLALTERGGSFEVRHYENV